MQESAVGGPEVLAQRGDAAHADLVARQIQKREHKLPVVTGMQKFKRRIRAWRATAAIDKCQESDVTRAFGTSVLAPTYRLSGAEALVYESYPAFI